MNTFFAIIGHGANDLEIPLVICQTREEAQAIVDQLPKGVHKGWLDEAFAESREPYVDSDYERTQESRRLYSLIFKDGRYYAGCGGCYSVSIEELQYGQPMVGWDLD